MTANLSPRSSARLSARVYLPRAIGLALGAICVGASIFESMHSAFWVCALLLTNALLWPHAAYILASRSAHPRHGLTVALSVADIDQFKGINDKHGHSAGDSAIRMTGQVFSKEIRCADVVARIGRDEFVVLMPVTSTSEAFELTQRLQHAFSNAIADDHRLAGSTLSFGIAAPHPDMESHQEWMELADRALYKAKARGRGSVEIAESGN
jgi:diguanylate cyclase (GGDEF)-like protein